MATELTNEQIERRQQLLEDHRRGMHFVLASADSQDVPKWSKPASATNDGFPACPACEAGWRAYNVTIGTGRYRISHEGDDYWKVEDRTGLTDERRGRGVDVYGPSTRFGGQPKPAEVNWSGCGSQEPEAAFRYACAIQIAADIAKELDAAS